MELSLASYTLRLDPYFQVQTYLEVHITEKIRRTVVAVDTQGDRLGRGVETG